MNFIPCLKFSISEEVPDKLIAFFGREYLVLIEKSQKVTLPEGAMLSMAHCKCLHIGHLDGKACGALELPDKFELPECCQKVELRFGLNNLPDGERNAVGRALEMLFWRSRRQFCGVCGKSLVDSERDISRVCPECGAAFFPVIAPAVIVLVRRNDRILLAHNRKFRDDMFGLVAGFVEYGETLEHAVKREIFEEIGIKVKNIRYSSSQCWPFPNSLMTGFTAEYESGDIQVDGVEITAADWFSPDEMPLTPRPGSIAHEMIADYLKKYKR